MIFRHFGSADAALTARRLRDATAVAGVRLLIGLDVALAESVQADGIHLPERALEKAERLRPERPDWLLTGAAHSANALALASVLDATVLSPVFPAGGASAARPELGVERFAQLARSAPCPVYALGGIHGGNARELIGSGACGLAGVEAIRAAFGPK